ncbi:hypothetical protein R1flu_024553 [Riccia fluitans]|uniref:Uncharacterized protein n=1 Tax=Riccia fluitans TaxID=41844 RepID=A0ABD1XV83_9MARC
MDRGSGHLKITRMLLLASLVAGAIHSIVAAVPGPPSSNSSSTSTSTDDASLFTKYKQATKAQLGEYTIIWTDLNLAGKKQGKCYETGYYDDSLLPTPTSVQLCFTNLRSTIVNNYNLLGVEYLADTFYYADDRMACVVNCLLQPPVGSTALSSVPISFLPLALSPLAMLTLNYL